MSNLTKLEFVALNLSSTNYLSWILDAEIHLEAMALGDTIKDGNKTTQPDKAKEVIFIRHHQLSTSQKRILLFYGKS